MLRPVLIQWGGLVEGQRPRTALANVDFANKVFANKVYLIDLEGNRRYDNHHRLSDVRVLHWFEYGRLPTAKEVRAAKAGLSKTFISETGS